ncbi:VTT domain-containing protein [Patescibacteria group bacterium]|nr:VTT domain-containing protein [Patescibacteria group bacterium]
MAFLQILNWIIGHGYWVMFVATFFEGPLVTIAAAFAAALHVFNVWAVLAVAVAGDFSADILYYSLGYFGRIAFLEKYGSKIGVTAKRAQKMDNLVHEHFIKTLLITKLAPLVPGPIVIVFGTSKIPPRRFITTVLTIIISKTAFYVAVGYFFGQLFSTNKYLQHPNIITFAILLFAAGVYWLYKWTSKKIAWRFEE